MDSVKPNACDDLEKRTRPRSRERLDTDAAKRLKALMKATDQGLGVSRYTYCELPILWVADKDGEVWFGLEEIVDEASPNRCGRRSQKTWAPSIFSQ